MKIACILFVNIDLNETKKFKLKKNKWFSLNYKF